MKSLPPIYFAHANGFPAESYQELFDDMADEFKIYYLSMFGHENYPVTNNWPFLVEELIEHLSSLKLPPVLGIGHSMGGVLIYMAACRAPHLFDQIILLDSPLLGRLRSFLLKLIKFFKSMHYLTPQRQALNRCKYFPNPEHALNYFKKKSLFKEFSARSLALYVEKGLKPTAEGWMLRFNNEIESNIFGTIPDNLLSYELNKRIKRSLIYSLRSHIVSPSELKVMQSKQYGFKIYPFSLGTHLFPFEYPSLVAEMIKNIVRT